MADREIEAARMARLLNDEAWETMTTARKEVWLDVLDDCVEAIMYSKGPIRERLLEIVHKKISAAQD